MIKQPTAEDFARLLWPVPDEVYPEARRVVLACGSLNTYTTASMCQLSS